MRIVNFMKVVGNNNLCSVIYILMTIFFLFEKPEN
jgi:hypothetical protein